MTKISKSSERNTFQKESYIKRQKEKNEEVDNKYLDWWDQIHSDIELRENDVEWQKNNLEYDLRSNDWILQKVREKDYYAQNLYAALCNNDFQKLDVIPILKNDTWSCSWRYAGGIIADMRKQGDYIDWYCSGMGGLVGTQDQDALYVSESTVTDEIKQDLKKLGWGVLTA